MVDDCYKNGYTKGKYSNSFKLCLPQILTPKNIYYIKQFLCNFFFVIITLIYIFFYA